VDEDSDLQPVVTSKPKAPINRRIRAPLLDEKGMGSGLVRKERVR
jgi:hypothetical protein